jgi:hypothetical protein
MKEILLKIKLYFLKRKLINQIISYFETYHKLEVYNFNLNINNRIYLSKIKYIDSSSNSENDISKYEINYLNNQKKDSNSQELNKGKFISFLKNISLQDLLLILSHIKNDENVYWSKIKLNKLKKLS